MGICRRAWLYLIRNKGKTGILLALLVVISTLVLLCVSIGNAANASLASLRERLGGYFSVKMNREQGYYEFVKDEMVQDILEVLENQISHILHKSLELLMNMTLLLLKDSTPPMLIYPKL